MELSFYMYFIIFKINEICLKIEFLKFIIYIFIINFVNELIFNYLFLIIDI